MDNFPVTTSKTFKPTLTQDQFTQLLQSPGLQGKNPGEVLSYLKYKGIKVDGVETMQQKPAVFEETQGDQTKGGGYNALTELGNKIPETSFRVGLTKDMGVNLPNPVSFVKDALTSTGAGIDRIKEGFSKIGQELEEGGKPAPTGKDFLLQAIFPGYEAFLSPRSSEGVQDVIGGGIATAFSVPGAAINEMPVVRDAVTAAMESKESFASYLGDKLGTTDQEKETFTKSFNNLMDLAMIPLGSKALDSAGKLKGKAKGYLESKTGESAVVSKNLEGLNQLESANSVVRKVVNDAKQKGVDVKDLVSKTDLLKDSVDVDGTIRTTGDGGAIEQLTEFIKPKEKVISQVLEREGGTINLKDLKSQMEDAVNSSNIMGANKTSALKSIADEIEGLALDADAQGNISLSRIQDAKINKYSTINYSNPSAAVVDKLIAKALKEVIEKNTKSADVAALNKELGSHYAVLKFLEKLDGKKVKNGRLGKFFMQTAGAIAGSSFGPLGSMAGFEVAGRVQGKMMQGTFKGETGKGLQTSEAMKSAMDQSNSLGSRNANQSTTMTNVMKPTMDEGIKSTEPTISESVKKSSVLTDRQLIDGLSDKQKAQFYSGTKAEQSKALEHIRLKWELENKDAMLGAMKSVKTPTEGIPTLSEATKLIEQNGGYVKIDTAPLAAQNAYAAVELAQSLGLNKDYLYTTATKKGINLNERLQEYDRLPKSGEKAKSFGADLIEELATESPGFKTAGTAESAKATVISLDEIKKTLPGYSKETSQSLQKSAAIETEKQLIKAINEDTSGIVRLLGGGPGSGKTEILLPGLIDYPSVIWDGTLANIPIARKMIDLALSKGKSVEISPIYTPIQEAFEFAGKRPGRAAIAADPLIERHVGFRENIVKLLEEYPKVEVSVADPKTGKIIRNAILRNLVEEGAALERFSSRPEMLEFLKKEVYSATDAKRLLRLGEEDPSSS